MNAKSTSMKLLGVLGSAFAVILFFGSSLSAAEKLMIKVGSTAPPGSFMHEIAELYQKKVQDKSKGSVEITIFPSAQLGTLEAQQEGMRVGTHQITVIGSSIAALVPQYGIFDLPYLFETRKDVNKVVNGPVGEELFRLLPPKGLIGLGFWENGITHMTNNIRPIVKPEDLKGLKMRTPSAPSRLLIFKTYGANPVPMPFSELFTALKQGVVDGQDNPYANIMMGKLQEVQKYLSNTGHIYSSLVLIASKMWWDKWPADVQKILKEAAYEVGNESREMAEKSDVKNLEFLKQSMKINEVDRDAFKKASVPIQKELAQQIGKDIYDKVVKAIE